MDLCSLMVIGLNSVDKLMICAETGMPSNDELGDIRKGNAGTVHTWLAEKQITKERGCVSERAGVIKSKIFKMYLKMLLLLPCVQYSFLNS